MDKRPLTAFAVATSVVATLTGLGLAAVSTAAADAERAASLPLGPASLPETRTVTTLQSGVTHTLIQRGVVDASVAWVVELNIPSTPSSPDPAAPARAVQDRASAEAHAARATAAGFPAEAQPVEQWATVDVADEVIGHRVRLTTTFATKAEADAEVACARAAGYAGRSWYAGWDGGSDAPGRWTVHVLTIDPGEFAGELGGTFGPTLESGEKTTELAAYEEATAALNAGFFVFDRNAGAEGDPAGAAVYDGSLVSETVGARPVLVLDPAAKDTRVVRPEWTGTAKLPAGAARLDGLNRVPGLIRNCGGLGDTPTSRPLHDVTCTDAGELVVFTSRFGATTPVGAGREVVIDARSRVVRVAEGRGTTLKVGERSLQATGDRVAELAGVRVGAALPLRLRLSDADGRQLVRPGSTVVNGGPQLLRDGADHITQRTDGMVHEGNPSFQYGWALQRNPRTIAGVDAEGRTLLVTVDGRQLGEHGLSIKEAADLARALGMVEAINLDGGGSTAMVVDGVLVSSPSDGAGERAVGDAIFVR